MAKLTDSEIDEQLRELPNWTRVDDSITRTFDRGSFNGSARFVSAIAEVADELNHHPDVTISWSKVELTLSTHSDGGLTSSDFALARGINEIAA